MTTSALAALRAELVEMLAKVDTAELPAPDRISANPHHPGPVWNAHPEWIVRAITDSAADPTACDAVYIETPDSWPSGDLIAASIEHGRRIAMAILAACQYAEDHRGPVRTLRPAKLTLDEATGQRGVWTSDPAPDPAAPLTNLAKHQRAAREQRERKPRR